MVGQGNTPPRSPLEVITHTDEPPEGCAEPGSAFNHASRMPHDSPGHYSTGTPEDGPCHPGADRGAAPVYGHNPLVDTIPRDLQYGLCGSGYYPSRHLAIPAPSRAGAAQHGVSGRTKGAQGTGNRVRASHLPLSGTPGRLVAPVPHSTGSCLYGVPVACWTWYPTAIVGWGDPVGRRRVVCTRHRSRPRHRWGFLPPGENPKDGVHPAITPFTTHCCSVSTANIEKCARFERHFHVLLPSCNRRTL